MGIKFVVKATVLLLSALCFLAEVSAHTNFSCFNEITFKPNKIQQNIAEGGIKEVVPTEFQKRYKRWKDDLLSTDFGKNLWAQYANKSDFILTIKVSDKDSRGAGTTDYRWNENGELIGATIFLGGNLDKGFPDPNYYPVMNSIAEFNAKREISGNTLAATKFAHEFGHINLTFESNHEKIKLQNNLMPRYRDIFLSNGYNLNDPKLIDLVAKMGGTPNEIWENREYWGEATAMNFLIEKTKNKVFQCSLLNRISNNINTYAKNYEDRFNKISELMKTEKCFE